jgi:hypothetical protein
MTGAERVRRYRLKHRSESVTKPVTKLTEIARTAGRRQEFGEIGRLRAEIVRLKSDNFKLKAALQEDPDVAKLRKTVIDQRVEMMGLRQELRRVAKERDQYQARVKAYRHLKHAEARRLLIRQNHDLIIKALHPDRSKHVTAAELAEAERVVVALRPLFIEG